jgi:hypothetical protein
MSYKVNENNNGKMGKNDSEEVQKETSKISSNNDSKEHSIQEFKSENTAIFASQNQKLIVDPGKIITNVLTDPDVNNLTNGLIGVVKKVQMVASVFKPFLPDNIQQMLPTELRNINVNDEQKNNINENKENCNQSLEREDQDQSLGNENREETPEEVLANFRKQKQQNLNERTQNQPPFNLKQIIEDSSINYINSVIKPKIEKKANDLFYNFLYQLFLAMIATWIMNKLNFLN